MSNTLKLVSFLKKGSRIPLAGALVNEGVINIGDELMRKKLVMTDLIKHKNSSDFMNSIKNRIANSSYNTSCVVPMDQLRIMPPVIPSRNVICVGKNYKDHVAEVNKAHAAKNTGDSVKKDANYVDENTGPKYPVYFTKAPECIVGDGDYIESHHKVTKWLDYEVELAVIIGKKGRDIAKENVEDHIFGYSIGNDITAREVQKRHLQWFKGKSLDRSCPLGPFIVPSMDLSLAKASNLDLTCHVNNELRQSSNTSQLIFDIPTLISSLSQGFTLQEGDVILTGTPDGVGFAMNPPQVLKKGDVVECTIQELGTLTNHVKR